MKEMGRRLTGTRWGRRRSVGHRQGRGHQGGRSTVGRERSEGAKGVQQEERGRQGGGILVVGMAGHRWERPGSGLVARR
jgi:hypothetical protein